MTSADSASHVTSARGSSPKGGFPWYHWDSCRWSRSPFTDWPEIWLDHCPQYLIRATGRAWPLYTAPLGNLKQLRSQRLRWRGSWKHCWKSSPESDSLKMYWVTEVLNLHLIWWWRCVDSLRWSTSSWHHITPGAMDFVNGTTEFWRACWERCVKSNHMIWTGTCRRCYSLTKRCLKHLLGSHHLSYSMDELQDGPCSCWRNWGLERTCQRFIMPTDMSLTCIINCRTLADWCGSVCTQLKVRSISMIRQPETESSRLETEFYCYYRRSTTNWCTNGKDHIK